jgi:hypothetical protein
MTPPQISYVQDVLGILPSPQAEELYSLAPGSLAGFGISPPLEGLASAEDGIFQCLGRRET